MLTDLLWLAVGAVSTAAVTAVAVWIALALDPPTHHRSEV